MCGALLFLIGHMYLSGVYYGMATDGLWLWTDTMRTHVTVRLDYMHYVVNTIHFGGGLVLFCLLMNFASQLQNLWY